MSRMQCVVRMENKTSKRELRLISLASEVYTDIQDTHWTNSHPVLCVFICERCACLWVQQERECVQGHHQCICLWFRALCVAFSYACACFCVILFSNLTSPQSSCLESGPLARNVDVCFKYFYTHTCAHSREHTTTHTLARIHIHTHTHRLTRHTYSPHDRRGHFFWKPWGWLTSPQKIVSAFV